MASKKKSSGGKDARQGGDLVAMIAREYGLTESEVRRTLEIARLTGALNDASEERVTPKPRRKDTRTRRRTRLTMDRDWPAPAPVYGRTIAMAEALTWLALGSVSGDARPSMLDALEAAYEAAFGVSVEYQWAHRLALAIDAAVLAGRTKGFEPAALIKEAEPTWPLRCPIPGYMTAAVVQALVRRYTPARRSGGGRVNIVGLAGLLTHPESLAAELDDLATARAVLNWLESNRNAPAQGWYWGLRPTRA